MKHPSDNDNPNPVPVVTRDEHHSEPPQPGPFSEMFRELEARVHAVREAPVPTPE